LFAADGRARPARLLRPKDCQRRRIIWRLDAGFGSDDAIKWLLSRDYQILVKGYNTRRAKKVALDVEPDDWQAVRPDKWAATVPILVSTWPGAVVEGIDDRHKLRCPKAPVVGD